MNKFYTGDGVVGLIIDKDMITDDSVEYELDTDLEIIDDDSSFTPFVEIF